MITFTENKLEQATLEWLEEIGYECLNGYDIAPDALYID